MRQQSCFASQLFLLSLLSVPNLLQGQVTVPAPATQAAADKLVEDQFPVNKCTAVTSHVYPDKKCLIVLSRVDPTTPLPVSVPAGTTVFIKVADEKFLESGHFIVTAEAVAPLDSFGAFIKAIVQPLSGVVLSTATNHTLGLTDSKTTAQSIQDRENGFVARLNAARISVNGANALIECVRSGKISSDGKCTNPTEADLKDKYLAAFSNAADGAAVAIEAPLPTDNAIADVEKDISTVADSCDKNSDIICMAEMAKAKQKIVQIRERTADLAGAQKSLLVQHANLLTLTYPRIRPEEPFHVKRDGNVKATIKVSAVDVLTKSSTDLATVIVTWQYSGFVISTGVMLSTLKNQTFANAPIIVDGVPVLDSTGKVLTQVVVNTTRPSVVFPLVMANYRLKSFQKHCNGNCSFLLGGGMGANLSSKTADFAVGPSFQYGIVLFTPVLHYGRQTGLTNGVQVGQKLGTSPPALPTNNFWKPAFGFAISYVLPVGGGAPSK